jgi:hypothetical protein
MKDTVPPELRDKIKDSIDPCFIEVTGTAFQSRLFTLKPDLLVDSSDVQGPSERDER